MGIFDKKTIIITGGSKGIGGACARLFVAEGGKVVIVARHLDTLLLLARSLEEEFGRNRVFPIQADISKESEVKELFKKTQMKFGPVSILVNNAAIVRVKNFIKYDVQTWDEIMSINIRGMFLCCREAFRQIGKSGQGGVIVNISSLAGIQGLDKFKGLSAYVVSKFGVVGLTESLAVEGKSLGIRVNCVAPGAVDTDMLRQAVPFLKTSTKPEDIARIILFLSDDKQSRSLNGSTLQIYSNE